MCTAVALKCRETVVDSSREMPSRGKRIFHFATPQFAALFAARNWLASRPVFLYKTYCRHKSLPNLTVNPPLWTLFGANLLDSLRHKQTRPPRTWGASPEDRPAH